MLTHDCANCARVHKRDVVVERRKHPAEDVVCAYHLNGFPEAMACPNYKPRPYKASHLIEYEE